MKGKPSVYITHDQIEAFALGDRIAVIGPGGVLHQVGRGDELTDAPANMFVAGFIGSPAMNLFPATLVREGDALTARGDGFTLPLPPKLGQTVQNQTDTEVVLGVRPDGFRPTQSGQPGSLSAEILEVEPLMGETELRLRIGSNPKVMALVSDYTDVSFEAGARLELTCAEDALHLFDATTGEALR